MAKLDYKIAKLRSQTQSEEEAVTRINHLLGLLGNKQFKLVCPTVNQGVSGYYTIEGKNGIQRSVLELSTGEKNLIAFLYFFYLVEARISDAEPVVIVIDDPVTSNDDQSMFLVDCKINPNAVRTKKISFL
ncbi:AAA family ATPase [Lacticaseibacillus paracasei]|uniref:AAA family ATPase n=1 Tax=Lacticaseibacillus paracasei TaxID=1597 RepID=UPI001611AB3A